jgi:hypothetical protein
VQNKHFYSFELFVSLEKKKEEKSSVQPQTSKICQNRYFFSSSTFFLPLESKTKLLNQVMESVQTIEKQK